MTVDPRSATRRKLLAASGSITLAGLAGCLGGDDDDGDDDNGDDDTDDNGGDEAESLEIEEFHLLDRDHDEDVIAYVHDDHWDHGPLMVPDGDHVSLGAHVEDADGDEVELGEDIELDAEVYEGADEIVSVDTHGDHLHVEGDEEGFTDIVFQLVEDDEVVYETPELEVEVGDGEQEHVDMDDDHDHGHGDDHDHDHDDDHDDDHDHDHDDDH